MFGRYRWPKTRNRPPVAAEPQYAYDGTYPLSRFLLISVNYKPNSTLSPSEF